MAIVISEIINVTDFASGALAPKVIVGYCISTQVTSSDEFVAVTGKGINTSVNEVSTFDPSMQYTREVSTNVSVGGGFAAYKLSPSWISSVLDPTPSDPIPGDSQDLPAISGGPPAVSLGTLPGVPTLSLTHASSGSTINFKCPKFGDEDVLDYRRLNKQTVGGKLIVYRDPDWTARESFKLEIENLTKIAVESIRSFLLGTAGQTLTFTDHRNIDWEVRVSNLGDPSIENVNGRYTLPLVLETI